MLEQLEEKVLKYFIKFSGDDSVINRKLYDTAWNNLKQYCIENGLPLPKHDIDDQEDIINKSAKSEKVLDIPEDVDVPYLIDDILTGGILE